MSRIQKIFLATLIAFLGACTKVQKPQLVIYGKDVCGHCHMTISVPRFGGQIISKKGKAELFDSVNCMHTYLKAHKNDEQKIYFVDSLHKDQWILSSEAYFGVLTTLRGPMGAGIFSVRTSEELEGLITQLPESTPNKKSLSQQGTMKWEQLSSELSAGKFQ